MMVFLCIRRLLNETVGTLRQIFRALFEITRHLYIIARILCKIAYIILEWGLVATAVIFLTVLFRPRVFKEKWNQFCYEWDRFCSEVNTGMHIETEAETAL